MDLTWPHLLQFRRDTVWQWRAASSQTHGTATERRGCVCLLAHAHPMPVRCTVYRHLICTPAPRLPTQPQTLLSTHLPLHHVKAHSELPCP